MAQMRKLSICLLCSQGVLFQKHANQQPSPPHFSFDKHFSGYAGSPPHSLRGCTACPFLLATQFQRLPPVLTCLPPLQPAQRRAAAWALRGPAVPSPASCSANTYVISFRPHSSPSGSTASPSLTDEETEARKGQEDPRRLTALGSGSATV